MPQTTNITANGEYRIGHTGQLGKAFTVSWDGTAANGNLRAYVDTGTFKIPISNADVTIGELDADGNERKQMLVQTSGSVSLVLSGATGTIALNVAAG